MAHTCLPEKASLSRKRHSCHFPFSAPNPRYATHTRFSLRLGHATALECHWHSIHYRGAASLHIVCFAVGLRRGY